MTRDTHRALYQYWRALRLARDTHRVLYQYLGTCLAFFLNVVQCSGSAILCWALFFRQVLMVHRRALGCKTVTKVSAQISIYLVDVYSRLSFCTVLSHCCQFTASQLQTICHLAFLVYDHTSNDTTGCLYPTLHWQPPAWQCMLFCLLWSLSCAQLRLSSVWSCRCPAPADCFQTRMATPSTMRVAYISSWRYNTQKKFDNKQMTQPYNLTRVMML